MVYRSADPTMGCSTTNTAGFPYEDLPCLYPSLRPFYTQWELTYDPVHVRDYMVSHPSIPVIACALYFALIPLGRLIMSGRKPHSMRGTLAIWNLALSAFSAAGAARTAPHLLHNLRAYGLRDCLCNDPESMYGSGATGAWVQMFVLSKFPELLDTFFIVIHKKPLIFLHWYHHFTVLLYCWHSYVHKAPAGLFFVVMNYAVHSFMYGYYFLMAVRLKPRWMSAMFVTAAQISQMAVGVVITVLSFHYYRKDHWEESEIPPSDPCLIKSENNTAALLMYGSYLFLFLQFFVGRYFRASVRKGGGGGSMKRD